MLRWILGLTLKDRKRNDDIRRIIGVACITDKVREARLRSYGHIQRREEDKVSNESSRQTFIDNGVEEDGERDGPTSSSTTWRTCGSRWMEDTGNRAEWKRRTHVADPSPEGFTAWRRERVCM